MITGFAFRSPEVVRFLINASKYNVCVVPSMEGAKPTAVDSVLAEFARKPNTGRKRVYLHKSVSSLLSCFAKKKLDPGTDYHFVFDALSILNTKPCVRIIDIETKDAANWQLKRTLPSQINKILETMKVGIDDADIKCLSEHIVFPEDLIHTDKKVGDNEKQSKNKSFLHIIQDIQSKNADKREAIEFWICAFYAGTLRDTNHRTATTSIKARWTEQSDINVTVYKEKVDKTARERMANAMREGLLSCGFELKKGLITKIMSQIGVQEHINIMRGLFLIQEKKYTPEKASYSTGANISALALIARCLWDRSHHAKPAVKYAHLLKGIALPKKLLKPLIGIKKTEEAKPTKQEEIQPKRRVIPGISIQAGMHDLTDLVVLAGLAPASKTPIQIKALSKSPIKTTAQKFLKDGKTVYKIKTGKHEYLRYQGQKVKLMGV